MFSLLIYALFFEGLRHDFIFEVPYTSKKQTLPFLQNPNYFVKNLPRKTFFPVYANTSKLISNNRTSRICKKGLEQRVNNQLKKIAVKRLSDSFKSSLKQKIKSNRWAKRNRNWDYTFRN